MTHITSVCQHASARTSNLTPPTARKRTLKKKKSREADKMFDEQQPV